MCAITGGWKDRALCGSTGFGKDPEHAAHRDLIGFSARCGAAEIRVEKTAVGLNPAGDRTAAGGRSGGGREATKK